MPQKKLQVSPGFKLPDNEDNYDPLLNTLYYHYTQQQKQDEERKKLGEVLKFTNPSVQRNLRKQREATIQAPYQTYTDELLSGIPKGFTGTESSVFGQQDTADPSAHTRGVGIGEALGNVPDAALKGIGSVAMLPWWKLKGVLGTEHLLHGTTDTEKMLKGGINYETLGHDDLFGHMFHTARDPNVARIYGSKLMKVAPEENQMIMDLYNPTSDDFARIYSAIKGNKTNERNVKNLFRQSRKGQSVEQPLTQLLREVEPEKLINTGMEGIRHPDVAGGNKEAIAFPKGHFPTDYFTGQPLNQRELSAYHHEVQMLPAGEEQGMRVLRDTSVPYNEIKKGEFRVAGTRKNPDIRNVVDSSSGKKYVIGQEPNNDKPYYIINKKGNQSTQHPTTFSQFADAEDYLAGKNDSHKYEIGFKSAEGPLKTGGPEGYDYNPISSDPLEVYTPTKEKPYYLESKQGGQSGVYDDTFATPQEAHDFLYNLPGTQADHYKISKQHYGQGGQAAVDPDNFHKLYPPTQEKPYYIAHNDGTAAQSSYHTQTFPTYEEAHDYLNSSNSGADYKIAHMNTGYVDGPVYYSTPKKVKVAPKKVAPQKAAEKPDAEYISPDKQHLYDKIPEGHYYTHEINGHGPSMFYTQTFSDKEAANKYLGEKAFESAPNYTIKQKPFSEAQYPAGHYIIAHQSGKPSDYHDTKFATKEQAENYLNSEVTSKSLYKVLFQPNLEEAGRKIPENHVAFYDLNSGKHVDTISHEDLKDLHGHDNISDAAYAYKKAHENQFPNQFLGEFHPGEEDAVNDLKKKYASQGPDISNKNVYGPPPKGTTPTDVSASYLPNGSDAAKKHLETIKNNKNYSTELANWMIDIGDKLGIDYHSLPNYDALKDAINMHAGYHGPSIEPDMVGGVSKVKDVSKGTVPEEAPNFVADYGEHTKSQLSPQSPYYITNKNGSVSNLGAHPTLASAKDIIQGMESDYKIKKAPDSYFGEGGGVVVPKGGQYSQDWENAIHHGIEVPDSTGDTIIDQATKNFGGKSNKGDILSGDVLAKPDTTGKLKGYQVYTPEGKLAYPETFGTKGWAEWWKGKTNNQHLIVKEAGTEGAASTTQKGAALGNDYEAVKQSLAKQGLNPDVLNFSGSPGYVEPIKQGGTNAPDINTSVKDLEIGKPAGGTHGAKNVKYKGEDYIFKPTNGPKFVDDAEYLGTAISRIVNGRTPLANVIQGGTLQKKYPGNFKTIRDLGTHEDFILKHPDQVPFLQQEAVADWLMGNHDSHGGQFLYDDKKHVLVPVDKGQAFKYWDQEKLSPDYHPNAKYGEHEPIQHTLMKMAKDGKVTLYYDVVDDAIKSLQFAFKNNPAYMQGVEKLAKDRYPNDPYEAKIFVDTFKTKLNNLGDDFMKLYSGHTLGKK